MNVLLSSVGRRSYLVEYFRKALGGSGQVVACNTIPDTSGMLAADIAEISPAGADPSFVEFLLEICRRHEIGMLFSLHDWEAPYIAASRERFLSAGIIPVVPPLDTVILCLDKYLTSKTMERFGVPTPQTFISLEAAVRALEDGSLSFPLMLKPRFGHGSIGLQKVENREELELAFRLLASRLQRSAGLFFLNPEDVGNVVIQACLRGQEYGVDIVNDLTGVFRTALVKRKIAMRNGETDMAETAFCPAIAEVARGVAAVTRHFGVLDADFFLDEAGCPWLLEMNPRFGGGYPFSHVAGADIPGALVAWARGYEPDPSLLEVRLGVRAFKDIQLVVQDLADPPHPSGPFWSNV